MVSEIDLLRGVDLFVRCKTMRYKHVTLVS